MMKMQGIRSLLNNLLNADKLSKRVEASNLLERGVEDYANQRVIEELEKQMELAEIGNSYTRLRDRIEELKQK